MIHAFGVPFGAKPPAIAWLGQFFVPLDSLFGSVGPALLLSIVCCQAVTLGLIYAAVKRLGGSGLVALAASVLAAGSPLFVTMSQQYFTESIQAMSVAWLLFVMASAKQWSPQLTLAQSAGAIALGLLSKLSMPLFMAAPTLVILATLGQARNRRNDPGSWRDNRTMASSFVAIVLTAGVIAWYSVNIREAVQHAQTVNNPLWATDLPYLEQVSFWAHAFYRAIFLPGFEIVIGVALVYLIAMIWAGRWRGQSPFQRLCLVACGLSIAVALIAATSQPVHEIRYITPLVPPVAVGFALIAASIPRRAWQIGILLIVALQFTLVRLDSFGHLGLAALHYEPLQTPRNEPFRYALERVIFHTCTPGVNERVSVVGADYGWLNANTLAMLADEQFRRKDVRCKYTPLGLGEKDAESAWRRVLSIQPPFFIGIDYDNRKNPLPYDQERATALSDKFNVVNRAVFAQAMASDKFDVLPGSRESGLVVLRSRWSH